MATANTHPFLDALRDRVLVFDGAMGTSLQAAAPTISDFGGPALEGWMDGLVLHAPHIVEQVHRGFLEAGCDAIETCSFQASSLRLREWGQEARTRELNETAAALARRLCDEHSTPQQRRFVAGSIGPTGFLPASTDPTLGNVTFDALVASFAEQATGLLNGGADCLIIETAQDILEVKASVFGARAAMTATGIGVPVIASVSLDTTGRMLLGTDVAAVLTILESLRVDVVGLNCSTGPDYMREPMRYLSEHSTAPLSCIPNAGLPVNVDGQACYLLEPAPMADQLARFVHEQGVSIVGGCCGSTPGHIRELVSRVRSIPRADRHVDTRPRLASAMRAYDLRQQPAPLLIGERVNAQGSRAVKRLLLADDYDGVLAVARNQVDGGAHALDVCVALTERADEAAQMQTLVKTLQASVDTPLVIDSTDADVIRAALEANPGRGVVNSVNLENGRARCDAVLPLVRDHGACVIALTIDEEGMARTAERKLAVARRIHDLACGEFGLAPEQLLFDALTFTLATGEQEWAASAHETIEGIRAIKHSLTGVLTVLGVSNVSFGLPPKARPVLNSVFLHHCVEAGLDAAIINPAHITPYAEIEPQARRLAEDLIHNRSPDALTALIAHFEGGGDTAAVNTDAVDRYAGMTPAERIHAQILQRHKEGIEEQIDLALQERDPVAVLNQVLLPAMKDVGDRFGAGELILPFVLQSAEVMKRAVAHLEQYLEKREGYTKGKVVLATVYGDVHDIGKNLVNTILSNNGYTVFDLGKQVPLTTIIDKAQEVDADAIGLSALLVSTSRQMPLCVKELDERGLTYPLIIGGAAINRGFGRRILFLDADRMYQPGVFYCKDAFEGLSTVDQLLDATRREDLVHRLREEALAHRDRERDKQERRAATVASNGAAPARSTTRTDAPIPDVPFWGARALRDIPIWEVHRFIDRNSLFKMSWQFRGVRDPEVWQRLLAEELEPRLQRSMDEAEREGWLQLQAVYGYWPALADGDAVVVYDPDDIDRELGRFNFPRQGAQNRLCLADYVRPVELAADGERDVVALQVVTTGPRASERSNALQAAGEYDDMLRVHGFATQMAEATAEYVHQQIRRELRLGEDQGRRYSWGYPACPDLEDHQVLFRIVPADDIGVTLTSGHQLVPEQSTAAIVMHHPEARYFAVYGASDAADDAAPGAPEPALSAQND
ncbi:MAG: methionine synthase [Candidatus Dormibacteraeota bacterium]|nr:methionine synthase [Candidatus Dormibacteraeota bacterium]MBV9526645.1 methionine synthase [Candidatus Dormibacteraeota bacterium]